MRCATAVVVAGAVAVPVVFSAGVWCVLASAALGPWALVGVGAVAVAAVLSGTRGGGRVTARLLAGARSPTEVERGVLAATVTLACRVGYGPPLVELRIQGGSASVLPTALGDAVVALPGGLVRAVHEGRVRPREAAAGMVHAAAVSRSRHARHRLGLLLWCLPWSLLVALVSGARRSVRSVRLVAGVWRLRGVVVAVAVVQAVQAGHPWTAVVTVAVGAVSYLWLRAEVAAAHALEAVGDEAVARAGLGGDYLQLLAVGGQVVDQARWARLSGERATTAGPVLEVVC